MNSTALCTYEGPKVQADVLRAQAVTVDASAIRGLSEKSSDCLFIFLVLLESATHDGSTDRQREGGLMRDGREG